MSRRWDLRSLVVVVVVVVVVEGITATGSDSSIAAAEETSPPEEASSPAPEKPYAPIENLLPATRVKLLLDRSTEAAQALKSEDLSADKKHALLSKLQNLLLEPRSIITEYETRGIQGESLLGN